MRGRVRLGPAVGMNVAETTACAAAAGSTTASAERDCFRIGDRRALSVTHAARTGDWLRADESADLDRLGATGTPMTRLASHDPIALVPEGMSMTVLSDTSAARLRPPRSRHAPCSTPRSRTTSSFRAATSAAAAGRSRHSTVPGSELPASACPVSGELVSVKCVHFTNAPFREVLRQLARARLSAPSDGAAQRAGSRSSSRGRGSEPSRSVTQHHLNEDLASRHTQSTRTARRDLRSNRSNRGALSLQSFSRGEGSAHQREKHRRRDGPDGFDGRNSAHRGQRSG